MVSRRYPRAPITEAVFEILLGKSLDDPTCAKVKTAFQNEHRLGNDGAHHEVQRDAASKRAEFKEAGRGFRFATLDQTDILVISNNRFSVSKLAPYLGWEPFRERAERDWRIFRGIVGYQPIARIGVRYINRIDIPNPEHRIELRDYFRFQLEVPQPPFPVLGGQVIQAVFGAEDVQIIVNFASFPSPLLGPPSFSLDPHSEQALKV